MERIFTDENPKRWRFEAVKRSNVFRNLVALFDLDTKRVFDVGCSYGEHLIHFGEGSVGLSLEKNEVAYGKEHGIDIRKGNIEEGFTAGGLFDVVYANNIFEHMASPHAFLMNIKKFLTDEGILILGVPCLPSIRPLMRISKFNGAMHPAHINFFVRDTLKCTVEQAGWRVQAVRGFRFKNAFLDALLNPIYPHFYVIATKTPNFQYHESRQRELRGYAAKEGAQ